MVAIIGGMGPLASAEFVSTVYERSGGGPEQEAPAVVLWSDPGVPDRTSALLDGRADVLARWLQEVLERCCALGAEEIVVCCVTIHAVLPRLPHELRARVVSLVEVLLSGAIARASRLLLLTSVGTRRAGVLEAHPLWRQASRWLCWPDDGDQQQVQRAIYDIKRNRDVTGTIALIESLLRKYEAGSFAAGCTELHLVHRRWRSGPARCVDPLDIIATRIAASCVRNRSSEAAAR